MPKKSSKQIRKESFAQGFVKISVGGEALWAQPVYFKLLNDLISGKYSRGEIVKAKFESSGRYILAKKAHIRPSRR